MTIVSTPKAGPIEIPFRVIIPRTLRVRVSLNRIFASSPQSCVDKSDCFIFYFEIK